MFGLLLALAFLPAAPRADALQEQTLTVELASFTTENWPQGQAVVTVLGKDGRAVPGMTQEHFQVQVNGSPAPVASVTQGVDSSVGIAVVLALDTSSSMGAAALEQAKAAALSFLNGLGPNDSVAVVAFAGTIGQLSDFTQERAAVQAAIQGLQAQEGTALYRATTWSVGEAASSGTDRRAVVLLSDGVDNAGGVTRASALDTAEALGVPVFTIGLGPEMDRAYLQELASRSGGRFAETPSPEGLAQLYEEVGELLRGQYILALDGAAITLAESEPVTLRVDVSVGGLTGSAERVFTPQGPAVTLSGIEPGAQLGEKTVVVAEVTSADPVALVAFLVDGEIAAELTEPPYEFAFDPESFPEGDHVLGATVTTEGGDSATAIEVAVRTGALAADGGDSMTLLAAAVVVVAAVAAALLVFILGRRRSQGEKPEPVRQNVPLRRPAESVALPTAAIPGRLWPRDEEQPPPVTPEIEVVKGRLMATSGPLAGQSFSVGETPTSIGSGHRCRIRLTGGLEEGEEAAPEMARVWVRGGQLMVHDLMRLTAEGPVGGNWAILDPGETFSIGDSVFGFELDDGSGLEPKGPREIPDILRSRSEPSVGPFAAPEAGQEPAQGPAMASAEEEVGGRDTPREDWPEPATGG